MSWEDQGRQYHEWFGHGTAGHSAKTTGGGHTAAAPMTQRAQSVALGMIAALPQSLRQRMAARQNAETVALQTRVLAAWAKANTLPPERFAQLLLGRTAGDPIAFYAHHIAQDLRFAGSDPRELQRASIALGPDCAGVGTGPVCRVSPRCG